MGEPIVVEFFGGPWDGEVRALPEECVPNAIPCTIADHPWTARASSAGWYVRAEHTRFGDPYRYEWRANPERQEES